MRDYNMLVQVIEPRGTGLALVPTSVVLEWSGGCAML